MRFIFTTIVIGLLAGTFLFSAEAQVKNFTSERDSLKTLKQSLISVNKSLKKDVDSLKNISDSLDKKIKKAKSELFGLNKKYFGIKYGKEVGNRVLEGEVWKGMTEEMMRDGWGKPDKTHTNRHKWGVFTQWYYGDITYFFKNGKLIDWEEKTKK